jgi:hypothetical protein
MPPTPKEPPLHHLSCPFTATANKALGENLLTL